MTIFEMMGEWGGFEAFAYEFIVTHGMGALYDRGVAEILSADPQGPVLDVGCGAAPVAVRLAKQRPDLQITATDLSPEMVRRAGRRASEAGAGNLTVRQANAMDLSFPEESFGTVLSFASIKHWPDQAKGVSEIHRVLKPGGRTVILEADRSCTYEASWRFAGLWRFSGLRALRLANVAYFRTFVAGQSLDLEDARSLMAASPFRTFQVWRDPEMPFLVIAAEKAPAESAKRGKGPRRAR
jgi:SAM-dependent methyltransferase